MVGKVKTSFYVLVAIAKYFFSNLSHYECNDHNYLSCVLSFSHMGVVSRFSIKRLFAQMCSPITLDSINLTHSIGSSTDGVSSACTNRGLVSDDTK